MSMSREMYTPSDEPYYNEFIRNGYKCIGHGFMHVIFEKQNLIYKIVRSEFKQFHSVTEYENEAKCLDFLRQHGFSTPRIIKIHDKNKFIKDYSVMVEEKVHGVVKTYQQLSTDDMGSIMKTVYQVHNIEMPYFGIVCDTKSQFKTWTEYLYYLIDRATLASQVFKITYNPDASRKYFTEQYVYKDSARFLLLDPNEENFIFNSDNTISGIIDIDHPIAFDPLYEAALYLYIRPIIFNKMKQLPKNILAENMETIKQYAIIHSLADLLFLYEKDKNFFEATLKERAKNVRTFLRTIKTL